MGVSLLCNTHRDHLFCSKGRWHDTLLPKSIEYMKSMTFNSRKKKKENNNNKTRNEEKEH